MKKTERNLFAHGGAPSTTSTSNPTYKGLFDTRTMVSGKKKHNTKTKQHESETSTSTTTTVPTSLATTTTTRSTTTPAALQVPQILARIGYYLPNLSTKVITYSWGGESTEHRFRPNVFHKCFLVCRFWYVTLLQVCWHYYFYDQMKHLPPRVLGRYSHLFRHFDSYGGCQGPFNCTLLESLTLRRNHTPSEVAMVHNMSMQNQRKLVRMNPGLEYLRWEGSESTKTRARLECGDFELLDNLQELWLDRWNSFQGSIVHVLMTVSTTLETLTLQKIHDFKESDMRTAVRTPGETGLVLSRVKLLRLPIFAQNTELVYLAGTCPNLLRFDLEVLDIHLDADRLAKVLKTRCPKLRTLVIHDSRDLPEGGLRVSPLIRNCSASGLIKIDINAMTPSVTDLDILPSILTHSATLEHVYIDYYCEMQGTLDPKDILRLLVECRKLKSCVTSAATGMSTLSSLKILKSKEWGCKDLERLDLDFNCDIGGTGGSYMSDWTAPSKISSRTSFMGWYRHEQNQTLQDDEAANAPKTWLKELFGMVKGFDRLDFVTLNLITFSRSSDPRRTYQFEKYEKII
ncbi:hypothetical protein BGZ95_005726 [Linnemannia exigua]|uniref:Uncharacterized protein n=1 Tax=Linnemannia exigua TaxID=604196 RepID=A0AAD4DI92_9FUNG|nr:hypothetical protein BGZ95_005726 [Linnemannia exigua]